MMHKRTFIQVHNFEPKKAPVCRHALLHTTVAQLAYSGREGACPPYMPCRCYVSVCERVCYLFALDGSSSRGFSRREKEHIVTCSISSALQRGHMPPDLIHAVVRARAEEHVLSQQ